MRSGCSWAPFSAVNTRPLSIQLITQCLLLGQLPGGLLLCSTATVSASSAISRRPRLVLGSVSTSLPSIGTRARLIATRPPSMSRSRQVSPRASPRRQPVIARKRHRG